MQRQVVITGLGLVSSLGTGKEVFWQSLLEGRSGIRRLSRFDPSPYDCQVAGEVPDEAYKDLIPTKQLQRMSYVTQLATAATKMALIRCGRRSSLVQSACCWGHLRNRSSLL